MSRKRRASDIDDELLHEAYDAAIKKRLTEKEDRDFEQWRQAEAIFVDNPGLPHTYPYKQWEANYERESITIPQFGDIVKEEDHKLFEKILTFDKLKSWDDIFGSDRDKRYAKMYNAFYKSPGVDSNLKVVWLLQILLWWYFHHYEHPSRRGGSWGRDFRAYTGRLIRLWNKMSSAWEDSVAIFHPLRGE